MEKHRYHCRPLSLAAVDHAAFQNRLHRLRAEGNANSLKWALLYQEFVREQVVTTEDVDMTVGYLRRLRDDVILRLMSMGVFLKVLLRLAAADPARAQAFFGDLEWSQAAVVIERLRSERRPINHFEFKGEDDPANHRFFVHMHIMRWVAALTKLSEERARALISREDWGVYRRMLTRIHQRDNPDDLYLLDFLYDVDPVRINRLLQSMWGSLRPRMIRLRTRTQEHLQAVARGQSEDRDQEATASYFSTLGEVHHIAPNLAAQVSEAKDWWLLMAALAYRRASHPASHEVLLTEEISRARRLEPVYGRFFSA